MGAGIGAGAAIDNEPSPRRVAIEKAQAELRREVAVREERRRELEFLEKGGNPLDFFGETSVALWSPSPSDPLAEQFLPSGGKGSYLLERLANGDSFEGTIGHGLYSKKSFDVVSKISLDEAEPSTVSSEDDHLLSDEKGHSLSTSVGFSFFDHQQHASVKKDVDDPGGIPGGSKGQYERRNRPRSHRPSNGHTARDPEKASIEDTSPTSSYGIKESLESITEVREITEEKRIQGLNVFPSYQSQIIQGVKHEAEKGMASDGYFAYDGTMSISEQMSGVAVCKVDDPGDFSKVLHGSNQLNGCNTTSQAHTPMDLDSNIYREATVEREESAVYPTSQVNLEVCKTGQIEDNNKGRVNMCTVKDHSSSDVLTGFKSFEVPSSQDNLKRSAKEGEDDLKPSNDQYAGQTSSMYDKTFSLFDKVRSFNVGMVSATTSSPVNFPFGTLSTVGKRDSGVSNFHTNKSGDLGLGESETSGEARVKIKDGTSERVVVPSHLDVKYDKLLNGDATGLACTSQEDGKVENQSRKFPRVTSQVGFLQSHVNTFGTNGERNNRCPEDVLTWEKVNNPAVVAEGRRHRASLSPVVRKAHEDFILEEAESIKAIMNQNAEWARRKAYPEPSKRNSHWDFVLEEMAWLANDFMQERLWKTAAASQLARWVVEEKWQQEFHDRQLCCRQRKIAQRLANAVTKYWQSIETSLLKDKLRGPQFDDIKPLKNEENGEIVAVNVGTSAATKIAKNEVVDNKTAKKRALSIQDYAIRFLKYSTVYQSVTQAEAPPTPERISENGIFECWEDQFPEESLHYTVPSGAMEAYRQSIESQWEAEYEQRLQERATALAEAEVQAAETAEDSMGVSDFGLFDFANEGQFLTGLSPRSREIGLDNDDVRLQYFLGALDAAKAVIHKKKRKKIFKANPSKIVDHRPSSEFSQYTSAVANADARGALPSSYATGKRTLPGVIGSGVPTKIRTSALAARQRAAGATGSGLYVTSSSSGFLPRSDISSGETNSQQDDLNALLDCSISGRGMDLDCTGTSERGAIVGVGSSHKSKKKKKAKHHGGSLIGSGTSHVGMNTLLSGKKEQLKWKGEQFSHIGIVSPGPESIGGLDSPGVPGFQGLAGQQPLKKLKLAKQSSDVNIEAFHAAATTASSQSTVNNISNANKLKQISARDRSRKNKSVKAPSRQGIGIPWSSVEDQAIIGLVYELGPNWALMSDILSSTSQLKGIYRKPKECRERHKLLMERSTGDGGDSPEDSGSSQPHSSNSGAQRGGTRLALHRLHGPMEEDTLKAHLECLVQFHQQYRSQRLQNDSQEQKQLVPVHTSHTTYIPQICLNMSGGPLTPLELCEQSLPNGDLPPHGFSMQSTHRSGLDIQNILASGSGMHATSAGISLLQGANSLPFGPSVLPASAIVNATATRDAHRMAVSMRPLSAEEQQLRYNRIVAGRGLQSQGVSATGGLAFLGGPNPNDCTAPILPSGNSGGMMCGLTRGMSLSRTGIPGIGSPGVSNIVSVGVNNILPSTGIGLSGAGAVSPGAVPGPINLLRRPRESMAVARSPEEQRQMLMQEFRHQAVQGNSQAAVALSNFNSGLSSSMVSSPTQTFTAQQQQQHQKQQLQSQNHLHHQQQNSNSNQQAYFMRFANDRQQQQQKRLLQQQPPFPANNSLQPPLPASQTHPLSQQQHVLPPHSPFMSQQPLQSHALPQQQHAIPSSVSQQQSGSQQQQSVLPLPSSALQQTTQPSVATSPLNCNTQSPQQQQPVSQPSSGQSPQLPLQTKQQPQNLLTKHQQMQQHQQQQQQQVKAISKGNGRGAPQMQGFSSQQAHPSLLQTQQLSGQPMSHALQGQRLFQSQGPNLVGKQLTGISATSMAGQASHFQGQTSSSTQSVTLSQIGTSVTQQQKAFSQHFQAKQHSLQQQNSVISTTASSVQGPLSPPPSATAQQQHQLPASQLLTSQQQQQTSSSPHPIPSSQQQQQRRPMQQSHPIQRRPQQRSVTSSVGMQLSPQLGKNGLQQQGPVSSQMPVQPGHAAFQLGSSINNPVSMGSNSSAVALSSSLSSNSIAVHSSAWRAGPNFSPMSTGIYNLTRSNNAAATQSSPILSSSGMHAMSSSGNAGIVGTSTSSLTHAVAGGCLSQQSTSQMGGVPGPKLGMNFTATGRAAHSSQAGVLPRQQLQSQQHSGLQSSHITNSLGSLSVRPVSTSSGLLPSPTLGVPGGPVASPSQSPSASGSIMYNSVQPRQTHSGQSGAIATQGPSTPSTIAAHPGAPTASPGSANVPTNGSVTTGNTDPKRPM